MEILVSEAFRKDLDEVPQARRNQILDTVEHLQQDMFYPSLKTHKLQGRKLDLWECRVSDGDRLFFRVQGNELWLYRVGHHDLLRKVRLWGLSQAIDFQPWSRGTQPQVDCLVSDFVVPEDWLAARRITGELKGDPEQEGFPNYFQLFQNAHLRILGVPEALLERVRNASSLEAVLEIAGLPESTKRWMEDIGSLPELEEVARNSALLPFRTTLDRLRGYCEGKIKRLMLNLQPEQRQYVEMDTPTSIIKGTAGSGKTTVGIYRAVRLAQQQRRVLLLTYTKTLSEATKSLIDELYGSQPVNLEIIRVNQFFWRFVKPYLGKIAIKSEQEAYLLYPFIEEAVKVERKHSNSLLLNRSNQFFLDEINVVIKSQGLTSLEEYLQIDRYGRKRSLNAGQREIVWHIYEHVQHQQEIFKHIFWNDLAPQALKILLHQSPPICYDDIIIDEAQDLNLVDFRVIQQFLMPRTIDTRSPSSLMILVDAAQTLYMRGFCWKQAGIQASGRTAILRKNYRNTRLIATAAARLLEYNIQTREEYIDPEWTQEIGVHPQLVSVSTRYEQVEWTQKQILSLLEGQVFRPSDIAVLCPSQDLCETCKKTFESSGLHCVLSRDQNFNLLEDHIKICTIHSAKGLEFPVVFLLGLTEGQLPAERVLKRLAEGDEEAGLELERQRSLCYVGMTRAAEALYLVTIRGQESRFIEELGDSVRRLIS